MRATSATALTPPATAPVIARAASVSCAIASASVSASSSSESWASSRSSCVVSAHPEIAFAACSPCGVSGTPALSTPVDQRVGGVDSALETRRGSIPSGPVASPTEAPRYVGKPAALGLCESRRRSTRSRPRQTATDPQTFGPIARGDGLVLVSSRPTSGDDAVTATTPARMTTTQSHPPRIMCPFPASTARRRTRREGARTVRRSGRNPLVGRMRGLDLRAEGDHVESGGTLPRSPRSRGRRARPSRSARSPKSPSYMRGVRRARASRGPGASRRSCASPRARRRQDARRRRARRSPRAAPSRWTSARGCAASGDRPP